MAAWRAAEACCCCQLVDAAGGDPVCPLSEQTSVAGCCIWAQATELALQRSSCVAVQTSSPAPGGLEAGQPMAAAQQPGLAAPPLGPAIAAAAAQHLQLLAALLGPGRSAAPPWLLPSLPAPPPRCLLSEEAARCPTRLRAAHPFLPQTSTSAWCTTPRAALWCTASPRRRRPTSSARCGGQLCMLATPPRSASPGAWVQLLPLRGTLGTPLLQAWLVRHTPLPPPLPPLRPRRSSAWRLARAASPTSAPMTAAPCATLTPRSRWGAAGLGGGLPSCCRRCCRLHSHACRPSPPRPACRWAWGAQPCRVSSAARPLLTPRSARPRPSQVNDTVMLDLETGKIKDFIKFDVGNLVRRGQRGRRGAFQQQTTAAV